MKKTNGGNDSETFIPATPGAAPAKAAPAGDAPPAGQAAPHPDSRVLDGSEEFVPLSPPRRTLPIGPRSEGVVSMPTPGRMVSPDQIERLDRVPFEFADIRALAQRILKRAQEQGQQKLDSARKTVAAMEKEAADKAYKEAFPKGREEGYQKGLKDGMAEAEKKIAAAIEAEKESLRQNVAPTSVILQQIIDAVDQSRQALMAQAEGDLLLLALDLAKRLVGRELSVDPEAIKPLATECVGLVTDRSNLTVRVNPEDFRVMQEYLPTLRTIFTDMGPLHVAPDASIERGGIVAATREAEVDMRLATRLAAFEEVILGFSGADAIAPWSAIPPEAVAAAKAAKAESPYSLPPADPEPAPGGAPVNAEPEPEPEPEPKPELEPEPELAAPSGPAAAAPTPETADQARADDIDPELAALAGIMDEEGIVSRAGEETAADADLVELAELANQTEGTNAGDGGRLAPA